MTSVDLPEPETPVTAVNTPSGKRTRRRCRLCSRAPFTVSHLLPGCRRGLGDCDLAPPDRYAPVSDAVDVMISSGVPAATMRAAVDAGARPHVDDVIGGADRLLVVLDDEHGVAEVAQALQRVEQARVVALVQADGRLVEDVEHADSERADLRRQADALRLAARERGRGAVERQVVEPDVHEEATRVGDLAQDALGDLGLALVELSGR